MGHFESDTDLKTIEAMHKYGGSFVSWDPILYNPLINIYRKLATEVRTKDEHPLTTRRELPLGRQFDHELRTRLLGSSRGGPQPKCE